MSKIDKKRRENINDSSPIGVLHNSVLIRELSTKFINLIHHTLG